jgi:hypothetical protein
VRRLVEIADERLDPDLFSACFTAGVAERWPGCADLVAIDSKTSRRSHDCKGGKGPLHLLSAFATNSKLVLGQQRSMRKQPGSSPSRHC